MVDYIARTAEGAALLDTRPQLRSWIASVRARESFEVQAEAMDQPQVAVGADLQAGAGRWLVEQPDRQQCRLDRFVSHTP